MHNIKRVSKKVGFTIIFFMLLVGAAFAVTAYFGVTKLIPEIGPILQSQCGSRRRQRSVASRFRILPQVLVHHISGGHGIFPDCGDFSLAICTIEY